MKKLGVAALAVVALSLAWAIGTVRGGGHGDPKPAAPETRSFPGKVLAVACKNRDQGGVFEDVTVQQLGGRSFLVGKWSDRMQDSGPWVGVPTWIALDEVVQAYEFKDVESARKAYSSATDVQSTKMDYFNKYMNPK